MFCTFLNIVKTWNCKFNQTSPCRSDIVSIFTPSALEVPCGAYLCKGSPIQEGVHLKKYSSYICVLNTKWLFSCMFIPTA